MNALLVFVKYPEAGKVKTRLCPPLKPSQAANFYCAMMLDSLEAYRTLRGIQVLPQIEPPSRRDDFCVLLPWDLEMTGQAGTDLGARMLHAFERAFALGAKKAVAIGTDHPSLPLVRIQQAFSSLSMEETKKVVVGPADDGGYYLLGMSEPQASLFDQMPWSGPRVLAETRKKALKSGINLFELDPWYDVDEYQDLERLRNDLKNKEIVSPRVRQALLDL